MTEFTQKLLEECHLAIEAKSGIVAICAREGLDIKAQLRLMAVLRGRKKMFNTPFARNCKGCGKQYTYNSKVDGNKMYCSAECRPPKDPPKERMSCRGCGGKLPSFKENRSVYCGGCGLRLCSSCGVVKADSEFYTKYGRPNGECKECRRKGCRRYYKSNNGNDRTGDKIGGVSVKEDSRMTHWRLNNKERPEDNEAHYDISDKGQDWLQMAICRNANILYPKDETLIDVWRGIHYNPSEKKHSRANNYN